MEGGKSASPSMTMMVKRMDKMMAVRMMSVMVKEWEQCSIMMIMKM